MKVGVCKQTLNCFSGSRVTDSQKEYVLDKLPPPPTLGISQMSNC